MRSLFGRRVKGQVEQDNIQCSFEHGDLAFQWKLMTSEAFLSASVTGRHGGLERRSWQGNYLSISRRARE